MSFEYWGSIMNPEITTDSDAQCGNMTFEEFCDEMGYDTDSRMAERMYKACVKAWNKLHKALGSEDLFYDLMQEVQHINQ